MVQGHWAEDGSMVLNDRSRKETDSFLIDSVKCGKVVFDKGTELSNGKT